MGIKEKEEMIFNEWRNFLKIDKKFITDGVANEEEWMESKYKVIFFLKEVNGGEDWDQRDYLNNYNKNPGYYLKSHSPTITALTQFAYGIFNISTSSEKWQDIVQKVYNGSNEQTKVLKKIAIVNVKKTAGTGNADYDKINNFFNNTKNQEFLRNQLDLYCNSTRDKVIIVIGNMRYYYEQLYKNLNWQETTRGINYAIDGNRIVVDFCHPQARISTNYKYYALVDAVKEILAKIK